MSSTTPPTSAARRCARRTSKTWPPRCCCKSSRDDYAVLREFRGASSLATYLTVIARRICVQELAKRGAAREVQPASDEAMAAVESEGPDGAAGLESLEEVEKLLGKLPGKEREVVRLYYIEGRSYEEISTELNLPINSIGPILSCAKRSSAKESNPRPRSTAALRNAER